MLTPDADYVTAISQGTVKMAELYDLTLSNGTTYRYTSHSEDVEWGSGSEIYTSIPITRDAISTNIASQANAVVISLANITGDLFDLVQKNILDAAEVRIKRILWNETYAAGMELVMFVGTADVEFNRSILTLSCKSFIDSLNMLIPRHQFQEPCNHTVFDVTCELTRADFTYEGEATGGSDSTIIDSIRGTVYKGVFDAFSGTLVIGDTITGGNNGYTAEIIQVTYITATSGFIWYVELSNSSNFEDDEVVANGGVNITLDGVPAEDTAFYEMGEIVMTSGDNDGQIRPLLKNSGNTVTVVWPFPNDISAGDTYEIYPGCDQTADTCRDRFDNIENFRGFLYIPKIEESMT